MQDEKIEQLTQLIESSAILSESEKSDWMTSLPVMNTKQLADLEMILATKRTPVPGFARPVQSAPTPPPRKPEPVMQPPQASVSKISEPMPHIANLPAFLQRVPMSSDSPAKPKSSGIPRPAFLPEDAWAKKLHDTVLEKELPAAHDVGLLTNAVQQSGPAITSEFVPPVLTEKKAIQPTKVHPLPRDHEDFWNQLAKAPAPVEEVPVAPKEPEVVEQMPITGPVQLAALSDVEHLSANSFRATPWDQLAEQMQQLVRKYGYVSVSEALEKSPLYSQYVSIGKEVLKQNVSYDQLLEGRQDGLQITLQKHEFEGVADLLRKIQVN